MGQVKLTKVMTQVLLTCLLQKGRGGLLRPKSSASEQCGFHCKLLLTEGEGQTG